MGVDPSRRFIAGKISEQFERERILTEKGKRLYSGYTVRHGPKDWERPEI